MRLLSRIISPVPFFVFAMIIISSKVSYWLHCVRLAQVNRIWFRHLAPFPLLKVFRLHPDEFLVCHHSSDYLPVKVLYDCPLSATAICLDWKLMKVDVCLSWEVTMLVSRDGLRGTGRIIHAWNCNASFDNDLFGSRCRDSGHQIIWNVGWYGRSW